MAKQLSPKRLRFIEEYFRGGNASAAYRLAFNASKMSAETIRKRAGELLKNGAIRGRLAEMQHKAAEKAVVDRAWVIAGLIENVEIALGRRKTKKTVKSGEDSALSVVEVFDRDAAAANAGLKMLGQLPEVALFADGGKTNVNVNVTSPLTPQPLPDRAIAELTARFGRGLEKYKAGGFAPYVPKTDAKTDWS